MKITLKYNELLTLLSKSFGVTVTGFTLEEPLSETLIDVVSKCPNYQTNQKLLAIKTLREWTSKNTLDYIGLADAKWAIENWERFYSFVVEYDRLPVNGNWSYSGLH